MAGFGADRLARRMLSQAQSLDVPDMPDADSEPIPVPVIAESCGITLDPWQHRAATSESRKQLWLCSRQSGKSTTAAVLMVGEATNSPGALVLGVSPSLRQSGELFRKCMALMKTAEGLTLPAVSAESALRCELENGSRIIALPGSESTVRGYSAATLVVLDEAARIPDALVAAVRPMLATTNGRLVALTTPAGKRGWFFTEWTMGEAWQRTEIKAADCPRISETFLADERRSLGEHVYLQEYGCQFFDAESAAFNSDMIAAALSDAVKPLWGPA